MCVCVCVMSEREYVCKRDSVCVCVCDVGCVCVRERLLGLL